MTAQPAVSSPASDGWPASVRRPAGAADAHPWRFSTVAVVVALVALAVRLVPLLPVGLRGRLGYDEGVHLAGAQEVLAGSLPYVDFTFLHPPGVLVLMLPFALVGQVVGADVALVAARLTVMGVAAVNAVLVAHLLRGHGRAAALAGGGAYALWGAAAVAERAVLLEPLLNLGLLVSLVLLAGELSYRRALLAGIVLGLTCSVKVWPALLAATVLAVLLLVDPARSRPWAAGVTLGGLAWVVPTLAVGRGAAVEQVLDTQAARERRVDLLDRLVTLDGASGLDRVPWTVPLDLRAGLVVLVVTALLLLGLRLRLLLWTAVCVVALVEVLVLAPSYYRHYAAYTAPGLALLAGAVSGRLLHGRTAVPTALALTALAATFAGGATAERQLPRLPGTQLGALASAHPCVWSNDATLLLLADVRTRSEDCPQLVDGLGTRLRLGVRQRDRQALADLHRSDAAIVLSERYAGWRTSRELGAYLRANFEPVGSATGDVRMFRRRAGPAG